LVLGCLEPVPLSSSFRTLCLHHAGSLEPVPLPENRGRLEKASETGVATRWLGDLTCFFDGTLKFSEMECRFKETEKNNDPSDEEILSMQAQTHVFL
jgi:hypothetical protein